MWNGKDICPGTTPEYLSEGYFDRYRDILECSKELGTEVILYDDVDFQRCTWRQNDKEFPQHTQKRLSKRRKISYIRKVHKHVPTKDLFMGAVAMNTETRERIDLTDQVADGILTWDAPEGSGKLCFLFGI